MRPGNVRPLCYDVPNRMNATVAYIVARLVPALFVVLGVSTLVFALVHLVPGDPVEVMLGEYASAADREGLRQALGLDRPLPEQWLAFVTDALRFEFGTSLYSGEPVAALLRAHFAMTALLAGSALLVAAGFGVPLGIAAALRAGGAWDTIASALAVIAMSVPNFVLGPVLIIAFALHLAWLPVGGADGPAALLLPAVTLGVSLAAVLARMVRAALLDVLHEPYIVAARARGLSERAVVLGHACRNAALPVVTVLGLQLGALLGGAVITEIVFAWPGLGQLAVDAIHRRDYPVLQGCVLLISVTYVAVNLATDVLYTRLDPRIDLSA